MILEVSQYLELYLWKHYQPLSSTKSHILSIVIMVNEKFRERVPPWEAFKNNPDNFPGFLYDVLHLMVEPEDLSFRSQKLLLVFLIHIFNSLVSVLLLTSHWML